MPSSICRPPAARGPVRTVRKPTRRFSLWAKASFGDKERAQANAASVDSSRRGRFMISPKVQSEAMVRVAGIVPASPGCGSLVPDGRATPAAGYNGRSVFPEGPLVLRSDLLTLASNLAARDERFALITVVRREPPSSARVGDAAVVTEKGDYHGWV